MRKSIRITSGECSRQAGTASMPSATDATTSMSERRPSRSSSASRKTWLSSTRTMRIGAVTAGQLYVPLRRCRQRNRVDRPFQTDARAEPAHPEDGTASGASFGGQEQRVVGLAALLDVDLDAGMLLLEALEEGVERRRVLAGQKRQPVARLGQRALD